MFISLQSVANRLSVSLDYLRDLIDRTNRNETVLDPTEGADFWSTTTGMILERDLRVYENFLRQRRFVRLREIYAEFLVDDVELTIRQGWKSLLERVCERPWWMPPEWKARLLSAQEKAGCMIVKIDYDVANDAARNEVRGLVEEKLRSSARNGSRM